MSEAVKHGFPSIASKNQPSSKSCSTPVFEWKPLIDSVNSCRPLKSSLGKLVHLVETNVVDHIRAAA